MRVAGNGRVGRGGEVRGNGSGSQGQENTKEGGGLILSDPLEAAELYHPRTGKP